MIKLNQEEKEDMLDLIDHPGYPVLIKLINEYRVNSGKKVLNSLPVEGELLKNKLFFDGVNGVTSFIEGLKKFVNENHE